ncbi:molybdopterin oxidoreductase family protein [Cohnella caldifontis]|uniref:molybdopterin oxidoreductase family protein n=1 Tax=Cohnella caldifontis TaxID=3027471 RepID=UPI0023EBD68C|nr:molybdopterin oxidoreductase family protein [Cohnella sp. YIM B05605]
MATVQSAPAPAPASAAADQAGTRFPMRSHCCYCSMQCGLELTPDADGAGWTVKPSSDFPVATGRLCQKGYNSTAHAFHPERLRLPLFRNRDADGALQSGWTPSFWDEALDAIAAKLKGLRERHGPDSVAVFGGGSLTNEMSYLLGKFARVALGTRYIDYNGRYCMSSAAAAQQLAFGIDRGLNFPLDDIPLARYIILAGTNIAECQPTMMPYLLAAKKAGAVIVTIDPRNTMTSKTADIHIRLQPGFDSVLVNSLLHVILEEKLYDARFVETRTHGLEEVRAAVRDFPPDVVERYTGIPEEVIRVVARGFAQAETGIVLTARGLEQQTNGVEHALNYINLCLLTGKVGRPGCGYGAVTGQANGQGGREHGQKADQLPGYRSIEDPAAREYVAGVWGVDPDSLPGKGVSAYELFQKMETGEIKALLVLGSNPVVSSPNATRVLSALQKLELCVVVDLFETETAACADWLLPGSSFLETEGTLTNLEGRVFHRPRVMEKPPGGLEDYEILSALADRLGAGAYFRYRTNEEIFDEMCRATKGGKADYSGLTYERLRREKGVFWPCPSPEHGGTPRMFQSTFHHADGKARMHGIKPGKPAETTDRAYPYLLTTGRVGTHYLSGAQTRRTEALMKKTPVPTAEIHPSLAEKLKLRAGDRIRLESRRGSAVFDCKITSEIHPTTIFVPFHWGGSQSVNVLTSDALHPISRMPEFKIAAVRAERYPASAP